MYSTVLTERTTRYPTSACNLNCKQYPCLGAFDRLIEFVLLILTFAVYLEENRYFTSTREMIQSVGAAEYTDCISAEG